MISTRSSCCPKGYQANKGIEAMPIESDFEFPPPPDEDLGEDDEMETIGSGPDITADGGIPLAPLTDREARKQVENAKRQALLARVQKTQIRLAPERDRITTHFSITHEQLGESPIAFNSHGNRLADGTATPESKRLKLKPRLTYTLTYGDLKTPGLVVIENGTRWKGQLLPTEEEIKQVESAVVHVAMCEECPPEKALVIRPNGGLMFFELGPESQIYLTNFGEIEASLNVFILPR